MGCKNDVLIDVYVVFRCISGNRCLILLKTIALAFQVFYLEKCRVDCFQHVHVPMIYVVMIAGDVLGIAVDNRLGMWVFLITCIAVGVISRKYLEPALNSLFGRALVWSKAVFDDSSEVPSAFSAKKGS